MEFNRSVDISQFPQAHIQRSVFDLSHPLYTTFSAGDLIPIFAEDVLPGDSFKVNPKFLARLQTLLTPMMGNIYLDQYYFFVPNRLVFSHFEEMMGENKSGYWTQPVDYEEPLALNPSNGSSMKAYPSKSIGDYMGIPTKVDVNDYVSALPFRAYCLIWNEFFRSESLQDPCSIEVGSNSPIVDNDVDLSEDVNILSYAQTGLTRPLKSNRYFDVFSAALPGPQRGPASTLPINGVAPVKAFADDFADRHLASGFVSVGAYTGYPLIYETRAKVWPQAGNNVVVSDEDTLGKPLTNQNVGIKSSSGGFTTLTGNVTPVTGLTYSNLGVDLADAANITINDLRLSFATQRYYEALARSGARYTSILAGLFGIESPDSRLQRPEFLGACHDVLNIEQIVQTSESTANSPLGETGAYSLSFGQDFGFEKSFVEHGWIIGVATVRYEHNYQQGIPKRFTRRNKFDYWWPQFSGLGETAIRSKEIFVGDDGLDNSVFGYQEYGYEYRYRNTANVTGEMRSNYAQSLDVWHLADDYSDRPHLSGSWLFEDPSNVDRVLTTGSNVADQVLLNMFFEVTATRPMPVYSIPGGLDF